MKNLQRKLRWAGFVAYLSVPALSYAAPGQLADQPLWLGTAVKHNLMFAIDDSGSMDWELSFDIKDGTPFLNGSGNFIDSSGNLNTSGQQYAYVFANGAATPYDGRRLYTNRYAMPPIPQYASARSAAYNNAYYDPSVQYDPWPDFPQYTDDLFGDASLTATKVEPVSSKFGTRTVNLFTMLDTSTKGNYWDYDIRDSDMVCKANGASNCSVGREDYTFYPATYYLADRTGQYYYHATGTASSGSTSTNAVLVEAESGSLSGVYTDASGLEAITSGSEKTRVTAAKSTASDSDFIGAPFGMASYNSAPSDGNATYSVTIPEAGTVNIWIRNMGFSGSTDSIWARVQGIDADDVVLPNKGGTDRDDEWGPMRENVSTDGTWLWSKWGEVDLDAQAYTFELAYRETGFLVDQILFTTSSDTPSGTSPVTTVTSTANGELKECADATAATYLEYARNPARFRTGINFSSDEVDGFGFDGACLTKYEIGRTQSDSETFDNGVGITRTVLQEKQNFANWFKYYRRRHQAMRGGLASSIQGINGIKTGMFWLNNRRTVGAAQMNDMSTDAGVEKFLSDHYKRVYNSGTPLRSALYHALSQYKNSTGPVTSECQKNYTLLFTDGFNTQTSFSSVGNEDGVAGEPYEDTYSGSLADIAYKGYKENIRATLTEGQVKVGDACNEASPDAWLDCNRNPHMNTYTVGLGLTGNIFGSTHFTKQDAYTTPPTWPNVGSQGLAQIDDLYHAAVNGRGEMFSAQSPALLKTALRSAIDDIVKSIGSGSGVTFNSSSLQSQDGTAIYTTLFNSADWSGDIKGRLLDPNTGAVLDLVWEDSAGNKAGVAAILDQRNLASDPRVILTKQGAGDGVGFVWNDLDTAQKNDLRTEPSDSGTPSGTDADAQKRLAFLRGDRTEEGVAFRKRGSRMGDVVHSAPVYIGNPASGWPNEAPFGSTTNRYKEFSEKTLSNGGASDRVPALYVGTNGGMLHGFNAKNTGTEAGKELMAYVPNAIFSTTSGEGLHYLTDPNYSHKYYVDLTPVAQDVYTSLDGLGAKDWRTMLVGGLRAGGKGLFALDVTNPSAYSEAAAGSVPTGKTAAANTVMWEFTASDDANLGYLVSPPLIAMLKNGKWAVIFGNGYESVNGRAALMILFVEEGLDGTWDATDKIVIDTGVGSSSDKNGLSGITAIDTNRDSIPDVVYGGDLKGNMWSFDISDPDSANWGVAYKDVLGNPEPLFTAVNDDGDVQPITAAPVVALNTDNVSSGFQPNLLVGFGTGQYLAEGDQAVTETQSFYTIWDKGQGDLDRSDLALRSMVSVAGVRQASGTAVDWTNNFGWSLDFEVSGSDGERVTQKPILIYDQTVGPTAVYNSLVPNSSECSGGGTSVLYAIPMLTGLNPTKPILDLDNDGDFDSDDDGVGTELGGGGFNNQVNKLGKNLYSANKDQSGNGTGIDQRSHNASTSSDREGRLGWNEMLDE